MNKKKESTFKYGFFVYVFCNYWSANALEPMFRSERAAPAHHSEREARTSAETQDSQINPFFKKERKKTAKGFPGEVRPKP